VTPGNSRRNSIAADSSPCCKCSTDRGGFCFGDDEHPVSMVARAVIDKRNYGASPVTVHTTQSSRVNRFTMRCRCSLMTRGRSIGGNGGG
jgi:hypothetical protein